jgi:cellobiose phosphorylase
MLKLPVFNYTGDYPFNTFSKDKKITSEPNDPYFLLGNYRLTLFAHVSGQLEIITGERFWARMNQGNEKWTGDNLASIEIDREKYQLIGSGSIAEQNDFTDIQAGTGFIRYDYHLGEVECSRFISAKPSLKPNTGTPGYLTRVEIKNNGRKSVSIKYNELIRANYEMAYQQRSSKKVLYLTEQPIIKNAASVVTRFKAIPSVPYLWTSKYEPAEYEGFPPALFVTSLSKQLKTLVRPIDSTNFYIGVKREITLEPGALIQFEWITGILYENEDAEMENLLLELKPDSKTGPSFRDLWKKRLPLFKAETDTAIQQEMIWHAYILECMATYSSYFMETKIPSGTRYDYQWGIHVCARDHFQELIPLYYYNPELGKSGLRYMMKKMMMNGDMKQDEVGMGIITARMFQQSDNQLFFFWSLAEYLRITGDYDFLLEKINYYPMSNQTFTNLIERVKTSFNYLNFEVGKGPHGLIRLLNSDWSDDIHFVYNPAPYNRVWDNAESLVNSGMALVVLKSLAEQLQIALSKDNFKNEKENLNWLINAFSAYRTELLTSYGKELQNRDFLKWVYLINEKILGENEIYLLPQAFALQVPEVPVEKKKEIHQQVSVRLSENTGFRNREFSTPEHYAEPGVGENGAFWWVPNCQYIIGVSTFDKPGATKLFHKQLLQNYSRHYPDKWVGYWSASDFIVSSKNVKEGQSVGLPFSALPHFSNLYLWFKLVYDEK